MNARLEARLLSHPAPDRQRPTGSVAAAPLPPRCDQLRLLGRGLDALILPRHRSGDSKRIREVRYQAAVLDRGSPDYYERRAKGRRFMHALRTRWAYLETKALGLQVVPLRAKLKAVRP